MGRRKKEEEQDPSALIEAMRQTPGFVALMQYWNIEREKIIAEGKASRISEDKIQSWAKLDGFDLAVTMIAKLAKVKEEIPNIGPELADDEKEN